MLMQVLDNGNENARAEMLTAVPVSNIFSPAAVHSGN